MLFDFACLLVVLFCFESHWYFCFALHLVLLLLLIFVFALVFCYFLMFGYLSKISQKFGNSENTKMKMQKTKTGHSEKRLDILTRAVSTGVFTNFLSLFCLSLNFYMFC